MRQCERILAIGAHPDDVEYGCLGTLILNSGTSRALVCSYGTVGDPTLGPGRIDESMAAFKHALDKKADLYLLEYDNPYSRFPSFQELVGFFEKQIREFNPTVILTHSAHDTHQEHRLVHEASVTAARRFQGTLLCYQAPSATTEFRPNYFITIDDNTLQLKLEALQLHTSQKDRVYLLPENLYFYHRHTFATHRNSGPVESFELQYAIR